MSVLHRRSQLVAFRVSAEEYRALLKSCVESGARSIADFARATVLQRVRVVDGQTGTLHGDLTTVAKTLSDLDTTLDLARKRIRDVLGPAKDSDQEPLNGAADEMRTDDQITPVKD